MSRDDSIKSMPPDKRRLFYMSSRRLLDELCDLARRHALAEPECGAEPMCLGEIGDREIARWSRGTLEALLIVAVTERLRMREELAEMGRRLDIQRDLTAEATKEWEREAERAGDLSAKSQALSDRVERLDNDLSAALAELTMWEDLGDTIGPVVLPEDGSQS